jgi:uncharacterized repeat protein (TIGR03843 family)
VTGYRLAPRCSNYTFLVSLEGPDGSGCHAIYKPSEGERPLWDFPHGSLSLRERASFLLADALGWHFVPPTVVREGPHGPGSMQLFIDHDPRLHYFALRDEHEEQFKRMLLFDWLANNADRKGGHCLLAPDGKVWGIDHGLTFHAAPKLRTVIWDFAGLPIPKALLSDLEALAPRLEKLDGPLAELTSLLSVEEIAALGRRAETILSRRRYPKEGEGGIPWPII